MRNLQTAAVFLFILIAQQLSAQQANDQKILSLVRENSVRLGLTEADVDNAMISSSYTDDKTNIDYVYLQQAHQGIPVFNSIKTIIFRNSELLYSSGNFVYGLAEKTGSATPALSAMAALINTARHLELPEPSGLEVTEEKDKGRKLLISAPGIAKQEVEAQLFWVASHDNSTVRLAWNINIDVKGSADWWNVRVDAANGNVIEKDNWTVHEAAPGKPAMTSSSKAGSDFRFYAPPPTVTSAGYYVVPFPYESPKHHALTTEQQPWLKAGAGNAATTHGWHYDGTSNYSFTRGNNVFAYLDVQDSDLPGAPFNLPDTSSTAIPSLSFANVPNFGQQPATAINRKAAVTNLFYWNNIIHDVTYQYGFTEVSGNFQRDNMGRGGSGNDYVQAEAQDASGTNNANFATPGDGGRPRMQMFLFVGGGPQVVVSAPAGIAGSYSSVESAFSASNKLAVTGSVTGQVVYYNDAAGTHEACGGAPSNVITGKIALIDRGNCNFTDKVLEAQNAGAIGVIMVNNVGGAPIAMGGANNAITIPAVMVSQATGNLIAGQLAAGVTATLNPPVALDADYDNSIVVHEYGHGVSNRLTGGPANASCLSNDEQGGEGWSDYLAMMLTTDWSASQLTDGALARPMGTYSLNQPLTGGGIRNFPYSTDMSINPLTYASMAFSSESHFIGEIWCSALWDMTWNIIQQTGTIEPDIYNSGSASGNVIALRLVMEGLRLQPCRPGFLDARDAILAADSILYNGAHKCAIWKAFARRGMGFSAVQGSSSDPSDQVPAFDVPASIYLSKSAAPSIMSPGSQQTINLAVSCQCQLPSTSFVLRDTIPSGFSYVSSTGGTINGNVVTFSSVSFASEQETKNFSITIQADAGGCVVDSAINDDRTSTIGGLSSATIAGTGQWAASSVRSKSPSSSWRATTPSVASDFTLTSDPFNAGPLSVLSFWHYYEIENSFDGGVVELSTNSGASWFDAGPYMLQNGYRTTMEAGGPWASNQKSFSGVSYAQNSGQFINTVIDLSSFSGQTVRVRFRMRTDTGNPASFEGWYLDDILQLNGCGGIFKAGLYNASGIKIDSSAAPVFIQSNGLPTTIQSQPASTTVCAGGTASFTVTAGGGTLSYQWQVSTDGGVSFTDIGGATSATLNIPNISASMAGYLYRCIVDNGFNTATSAAAQLNIGAATVAGAVPSITACEGTSQQLTSNASGTSLNYQWQVSTNGGTSYSNISGAVSANYPIPVVTLSQNGFLYQVVVSGACGTATSLPGALTVNSSPSVVITSAPATICTTDDPVSLSASQSGGAWSGQGMSGNEFVPSNLTPGTYQVSYSISNALGCTGTATASIVVVNCADRLLPLDAPGVIIIYPNPNDGRFSIRFNTELYSKLSMRVFGSDGKLVERQTITGISFGMVHDVNLFHLASDVYMLSLYDEVSGREKTFKLLIAR